MADEFDSNKYLKAFDASKPGTTRFDYDAFLADIGKTAQQTRDVSIPSLAPVQAMQAKLPQYKRTETARLGIQAGMQDWQTQAEVTKGRAEKAATALETKGASTVESMRNLEALESEVRAQQGRGETLWTEAAKKAGEYVEATRSRTVGTLRDLDDIFRGINTDRDYAKAHAMQAGVQATLGAMEGEGRAIAEKYGTDSKEFQVFTEKKMKSLGNMQSQIEVGYANLVEEANKNYLNARTDVATKMQMYTGFQEQQHVETLMGMARSSESYAMQSAQFLLTVEQLRMAGMDDMANWITGTPEFSMELASLMALATEAVTGYERERDERSAARRREYYGTLYGGMGLGGMYA